MEKCGGRNWERPKGYGRVNIPQPSADPWGAHSSAAPVCLTPRVTGWPVPLSLRSPTSVPQCPRSCPSQGSLNWTFIKQHSPCEGKGGVRQCEKKGKKEQKMGNKCWFLEFCVPGCGHCCHLGEKKNLFKSLQIISKNLFKLISGIL